MGRDVKILSSIRRATSVRKALERAANDLNEKLAGTPGSITNMEANVDSGIAGAVMRIVVVVDESNIRSKCILWANEVGGDEGAAFRRAQEKINAQLVKLRGQVVGFYSKFITPPLPKRTYATLIVAVNEEIPEKVGKLGSGERRERLVEVLRLLGDDPRAINLAQVAKTFGVSRDTIYKDLQELGIGR